MAGNGCWDLSVLMEDVRLVVMETQGAEVLQIRMPAVTTYKVRGLLRVQEGAR